MHFGQKDMMQSVVIFYRGLRRQCRNNGAFKLHGGKMKARILETGALQVKRAGVWVTQFCPYRGKFCGDHYPKFDESAPLCDVEACGVPLKVENDKRSEERRIS